LLNFLSAALCLPEAVLAFFPILELLSKLCGGRCQRLRVA
jgi:hypothetical protein